MSMQSSDAKEAITALRCFLNISCNKPTNITNLLQEYGNVVGKRINFKQFGFSNIEDFLRASGEFEITKSQGEIYISAKRNDKSSHINRLVSLQRKPRKKPSKLRLREPLASDQSWNKTTFSSNVYQNLVTKSSRRRNRGRRNVSSDNSKNIETKSIGDKNNNYYNISNRSDNNNMESKRSNENKTDLKKSQFKSESPDEFSNRQNQGGDLRDRLNQKRETDLREKLNQKQVVNNNNNNNNNFASRAILEKHNNKQMNSSRIQNRLQNIQLLNEKSKQSTKTKENGNSMTVEKKPSLNSATTQNRTDYQQKNLNSRLQRNTTTQHDEKPTSISSQNKKIISISSIQDRLKINKEKICNSGNSTNKMSVIEKVSEKTDKYDIDDKKMPTNLIAYLEQYCKEQQFPRPEYKFLKPKFSTRIQCRVFIDGVIYSTYPNDFATNSEAQMACAREAFEQIKINEARKKYPVSFDTDADLALKIYQELKTHQHGIFCKNFPDVFQQTFQQTLPNHWFSIIESSKNLFLIETMGRDNPIIFAKNDTTDSSAASTASDSEFLIFDHINLPWNDKYWNLYITHCITTTEIWARIVGKEYSDQLDSLLTDIDLYMDNELNKSRPPSIVCGQLYLICILKCWHRVRVEEMNKSAEICRCFFIDFGDEEWVSMRELFVCETRFLRLPPQAIPFSLFGLEDFAENPNTKQHLDKTIVSKTLIGEVLTKKTEYDSQIDNEFDIKIQLVLYDTSSNEDINLNSLILTQICDDTPTPELKRTGFTNVIITHVNAHCDVFIQVGHNNLLYIQKLINQLVESNFKEEQNRISLDDIRNSNGMFLVNDIDEKRWYRAVIADTDLRQAQDNNLKMFFVDYGISKVISRLRIFRLDCLSAALNKFPKQAIKVKLHNLPPIDDTTIARVRGLLPLNTPAIVKIVIYATIPQVIVYRRIESNLVSINEIIRIEYELENANEFNDLQMNENKSMPGRSSQYKDISSTSFLQSNNLLAKFSSSISNSPPNLPKLASNVSIPPVNEYFDVFISMASNPSNFVVQPYNQGPELLTLMKELQEYFSNNDEFIPADMVEVGQAYAALNSDGIYHRVTVEKMFSPTIIEVCYCDFGDLAVLSNDKLKTLPAKFRTLPKQAIVAKLHGIKAKHSDWTLEDCLRFKELTVAKQFVSIIKNISNDESCPNSRVIEIELIDVETDEDIYIRNLLIKEGRAVSET